ncbi:MAG TPA: hypothetical protein VFV17_03405 [Usitatibacteraceae bacterium]|nr:hypothetical protein [Usitatibacteraceae bacterium]
MTPYVNSRGLLVFPVSRTAQAAKALGFAAVVTVGIAIYQGFDFRSVAHLKALLATYGVLGAAAYATLAFADRDRQLDAAGQRILAGGKPVAKFSQVSHVEVYGKPGSGATLSVSLRLEGGGDILLFETQDRAEASHQASEVSRLVGRPVRLLTAA